MSPDSHPHLPGQPADPAQQRLLLALDRRLQAAPLPPRQVAASVRALERPPEDLADSPLALVALQNLRRELFEAPRRDADLRLLWRESVTTAWIARQLAAATGAALGGDAAEAAVHGLLGRAPEAWLLRALGAAEAETGVRLAASVERLRAARGPALAADLRVAWRTAGLPAALTGRYEPALAEASMAFRSAGVARLLANELLQPDGLMPGVADAAASDANLPAEVLADLRPRLWRIVPLLERVA
jgi:hypothetical protein